MLDTFPYGPVAGVHPESGYAAAGGALSPDRGSMSRLRNGVFEWPATSNPLTKGEEMQSAEIQPPF
jgi:hypothetical protein